MFLINSTSNEIVQLAPKSFSELGFTERGHLQEWIAKMPESIGEELLIIQKEFDGFDETLIQLRDTLLPKLMKGEIRINNEDFCMEKKPSLNIEYHYE